MSTGDQHQEKEDTWFHFEADSEGWRVRQAELEGPEPTPRRMRRPVQER
ncbi:hypothetical protein QFZ75_008176 [Streptomyces sp. V3I8]|nr:hypothetical protein [Streptomyces sp. V3I8]MDQ1041674.1 hypothetical protein [Streptomyces sp. V3I8]